MGATAPWRRGTKCFQSTLNAVGGQAVFTAGGRREPGGSRQGLGGEGAPQQQIIPSIPSSPQALGGLWGKRVWECNNTESNQLWGVGGMVGIGGLREAMGGPLVGRSLLGAADDGQEVEEDVDDVSVEGEGSEDVFLGTQRQLLVPQHQLCVHGQELWGGREGA